MSSTVNSKASVSDSETVPFNDKTEALFQLSLQSISINSFKLTSLHSNKLWFILHIHEQYRKISDTPSNEPRISEESNGSHHEKCYHDFTRHGRLPPFGCRLRCPSVSVETPGPRPQKIDDER